MVDIDLSRKQRGVLRGEYPYVDAVRVDKELASVDRNNEAEEPSSTATRKRPRSAGGRRRARHAAIHRAATALSQLAQAIRRHRRLTLFFGANFTSGFGKLIAELLSHGVNVVLLGECTSRCFVSFAVIFFASRLRHLRTLSHRQYFSLLFQARHAIGPISPLKERVDLFELLQCW